MLHKNRNKTKEMLIEELRDYVATNNKIPKISDFKNDNGLSSFTTFKNVFNCNLIDILDACKIYISEEEKQLMIKRGGQNKLPEKDEAIKIILKMQNAITRPLEYSDFHNPNESTVGVRTITKYWGNLNTMKAELGLEINRENMKDKTKSKDEMLNDMKLLINKLGRLPKTKEIYKDDNILSPISYYKYFGGINNVFLLLGYKPFKKAIALKLSNDDIINIYKDFIEDLGVTPSFDYCKTIYELPSPRTVLRRFNCSWNDFITMLGYKTNNTHGDICQAKDGTNCLSNAEAIIHNYLVDNNINIKSKEYLYRDLIESEVLKEYIGYKRCDWLLQKNDKLFIVEYFGLIGNYDYDIRHNLKLEFINKANLQDNFIAIYPKDLGNLNNIFNKIIN